MAKFTYNDIVRTKATITAWYDIPGFRKPGPRVGERGWVFAVSESQDREPFPAGTIYGIEFEDGDALEAHEDDLELVEAAGPEREV
jgi:hypothetical protein